MFSRNIEKYGAKVLCFPAMDTGAEAAGTPVEVKEWAKFVGVKFPLLEMTKTKGPQAHPLFAYMREVLVPKSYIGYILAPPEEKVKDFTRFIVDKKGRVVLGFPSNVPLKDLEAIVRVSQ